MRSLSLLVGTTVMQNKKVTDFSSLPRFSIKVFTRHEIRLNWSKDLEYSGAINHGLLSLTMDMIYAPSKARMIVYFTS